MEEREAISAAFAGKGGEELAARCRECSTSGELLPEALVAEAVAVYKARRASQALQEVLKTNTELSRELARVMAESGGEPLPRQLRERALEEADTHRAIRAVLSAARDTPLARELEAQLAAADGEGSGGLPAELRVRVCAEYRRLKAAGSVVDDADENAVRNIEGGAAMVTAGARDSLASEIEVDGAPATPSVRAELPAPAPPGGDGDSSVPNAAPSPPAALLPPAPLSSTPSVPAPATAATSEEVQQNALTPMLTQASLAPFPTPVPPVVPTTPSAAAAELHAAEALASLASDPAAPQRQVPYAPSGGGGGSIASALPTTAPVRALAAIATAVGPADALGVRRLPRESWHPHGAGGGTAAPKTTAAPLPPGGAEALYALKAAPLASDPAMVALLREQDAFVAAQRWAHTNS